jgi:hypothetical protein
MCVYIFIPNLQPNTSLVYTISVLFRLVLFNPNPLSKGGKKERRKEKKADPHMLHRILFSYLERVLVR